MAIIFQVSVMMSQTSFAHRQYKSIDLKFNTQKEFVLCKKIKNTMFCIEKNDVGLPTIISQNFVFRRIKIKLSFDLMPSR